MALIYTNTRYRRLVLYTLWADDLLCVSLPVCIFIFTDVPVTCFMLGILLLILLRPFLRFGLRTYFLDERNDLLCDACDPSMRVALSEVSSVTYGMMTEGEFDSLLLWDSTGRHMEVHLSRSDADDMVARILKINPGVSVRRLCLGRFSLIHQWM